VRMKVARPPSGGVDALIVTALGEEHATLLKVVSQLEYARHIRSDFADFSHDSFYFDFSHSKPLSISIIRSGGMGQTEAAIAVTAACAQMRPKVVIQVGVAGGFKFGAWSHSPRGISLGDILIANEIVDLDLRRVGEDDINIRHRSMLPDLAMLDICRMISETNWQHLIPKALSRGAKIETFFGPLLSGQVILASDHFLTSAAEYQSDFFRTRGEPPIGIEMEGFGAALATHRSPGHPRFLMIRSISDFADKQKSDDQKNARSLARYSSSCFCVAVIQSDEFYSLVRRTNTASTPPNDDI
jgi:nucleoside phosphorylase